MLNANGAQVSFITCCTSQVRGATWLSVIKHAHLEGIHNCSLLLGKAAILSLLQTGQASRQVIARMLIRFWGALSQGLRSPSSHTIIVIMLVTVMVMITVIMIVLLLIRIIIMIIVVNNSSQEFALSLFIWSDCNGYRLHDCSLLRPIVQNV